MNDFFRRIRQSRVAEWTIAYLAFAWLIVQIIDVVSDVWLISDFSQKRIHVLLALGLPATSIVAWFHGERGAQRFSRTEVLVLAVLAGITALTIPTVGATEPVTVLGLPRTLILPCALISLIAIPAVLIVASARRELMTPVPRAEFLQEAKSKSHLEAIESSIWQKILQAKTNEDLEMVQTEVQGLLSQNPGSARLMRLEARLRERQQANFIGASRPERRRIPEDWDQTVLGELTDTEASLSCERKAPAKAARPPAFLIWHILRKRKIASSAAKYILIVGAATLIWLGISPSPLYLESVDPATATPESLLTVLFILVVFGLAATIIMAWYHGRQTRIGV